MQKEAEDMVYDLIIIVLVRPVWRRRFTGARKAVVSC